MKKLMIAAAIVCAAAFAQAASYNWEFYPATFITGTDGTGTWSGQMSIVCEALSFNDTITVTSGDFDSYFDIESEVGTDYTFVMTAKSGKYTYSQSATGSVDSFGIAFAEFAGGNAWTKDPEPTPEPTSAILMALGLAGLALRRKQK